MPHRVSNRIFPRSSPAEVLLYVRFSHSLILILSIGRKYTVNNYRYIPKHVCSREIRFGLEDGKIHELRFIGGCDGNLKAIGKLLEGREATEAIRLLKGNDCGGRGTSCADQLACALEEALEEEKSA